MAKSPETPTDQEHDAPAGLDIAQQVGVEPSPLSLDGSGPSWSQVWQLPVLLLGAGLFAIGLWMAIPEYQPYPIEDTLNESALALKAGNYQEAFDHLKDVWENRADASDAQMAKYWQYSGDVHYVQLSTQSLASIDLPMLRQKHELIISYYEKAKRLGREIDPVSMQRWAVTLVALGRDEQALAMVDDLAVGSDQRYLIVRRLIEQNREKGNDIDLASMDRLIVRFRQELAREPDRQVRLPHELWITELEASLHIESQDAAGAVSLLLEQIKRLEMRSTPRQRAGLHVQLGHAYQMLGQLDQAMRHYDFAAQQLPSTDPLNARILVGKGQITLSQGSPGSEDQALGLFAEAVTTYPSEPAYIEALIGQADIEARKGALPEALDHFSRAVEKMTATTTRWDPRRAKLTDVVRSHIAIALEQQQYERALDFLQVLLPMYQPTLPPALLLDLASAHEQAAEQLVAEASVEPGPEPVVKPILSPEARALANQRAAAHYEQAAKFYLEHARAVTISDDDAHGSSLWSSARCFDRGQVWKKAIETYGEYVKTRATDPRRIEAMHHLGKAYMADGQIQPALDLFVTLLTEHPSSPWTYESLVPLAHCYAAVGQQDKAERTLLSVVTDHPAIRTDSQAYREALIALGKLYYRMGQTEPAGYVAAIERLTEAVERYGDSSDGPMLRFLLADALRQSVGLLDQELDRRQGQGETNALADERDRRLRLAQQYYNQVVNELEARDPTTLTDLEKVYRLHAYFYQGDCAFARQDYNAAIELYKQASRRWENHPASMVALVQIVNAHCELGEYERARSANDYALWHLERMPEGVFDDPTLPMSRSHWEDWLKWTSELNLFGTQASAGAP